MSISQYKTSKGQTRWRVRYTRPDGTRTDKRGFTTKAAARQWEARTITGDVTLSGKNEPTINDLADLYLASLNRLAKGTANGYTTALHGHILPRWGRTRPSEITRANVQHWVTSEQFTWSVATRNLAVLAGVLTTSGYSDEATKGVTKPRKNFREHTYLTYPHLSLLAAKSPYPGIIYTLGLTGVRWGECAGARVKDYNPATRELHVVQTAGMIQGKLVIGRPKSCQSDKVNKNPRVTWGFPFSPAESLTRDPAGHVRQRAAKCGQVWAKSGHAYSSSPTESEGSSGSGSGSR